MQLITQINEASALPIEDLKKVMQKDARIKSVFTKGLDVDSIINKGEFLRTLKFFLLDNRNVIQFVSGRDYVRDLDKTTLNRLRKITPAELKQRDIDNLQQFVADLFREHSYVEKSGVSAESRKYIVDWVNGNGRYFDLPAAVQKGLLSVPNIRPEGPITLYRGLLFNASDLRERKRYDGQLELGKGLEFLKSVREGSRIVDLEWDRPSSWSTSKDVAARFAQFSSAASQFAAMSNWLNNAAAGKKIHGELGFIISTLAKPEDVLIDVQRLATSAHMKHGDEGEVILRPGSYTCRVSTKYTKNEGEVDPDKVATVDPDVSNAIEATKHLAQTWLKDGPWDHLMDDGWRGVDVERALRTGDIKKFGEFAKASTKEAALAAYNDLYKFYHEHIVKLSEAQLESLAANSSVGRIVQFIADLKKTFNERTRHSAHRTPENMKGETKVKNLTPAQKRETTSGMMSSRLNDATKGGRYTDYSAGNAVNMLLKGLGEKPVEDLHRKKGDVQKDALNRAVASFYKGFDMEQPADPDEALRKMKSALLGAERNAALINQVLHFRSELNNAFGSSEE